MIAVILRVRMWIEIFTFGSSYKFQTVILRVRMWIEMWKSNTNGGREGSHPPCEDVD